MTSDAWFYGIEDRVFTYIQYMLCEQDDAPFPGLFCTAEDENGMPARFPTLYLHEVSSIETGGDLENRTVNAVNCTMEIQVYAKDPSCKKIMTQAVLEMKSMGFTSTALPIYATHDGVMSGVARFRRIIGSGDVDIVG